MKNRNEPGFSDTEEGFGGKIRKASKSNTVRVIVGMLVLLVVLSVVL